MLLLHADVDDAPINKGCFEIKDISSIIYIGDLVPFQTRDWLYVVALVSCLCLLTCLEDRER